MFSQVNPVNWFEIPASDLKRATRFYEAVFDVKLAPQEMGSFQLVFFPMERGAAGAGGSLVKGEGYVPSHQGTQVYFRVKAIEASLKKIVQAGGKTLLPRTSIGQYGFIAHFEDSEGNRVALHEAPQG
jgi:predicted enzyme related to lactoylglutathione lyase